MSHNFRMVSLTSCQLQAMNALASAENVFLTGGAGSGKSYLLKEYLKTTSAEIPVLASTGAAAVLVGGRTFHSFFGIGILEGGPGKTVERASKDKRVIKRIKEATAVIIDEISMIPGVVLDVAESVARKARGKAVPWGGLRVIAVGDFGQLPPVARPGQPRDWAFQGRAWQESSFAPAVLQTPIRTKDPEFLEILNKVRYGICDNAVSQFLRSREMRDSDGFEGTRLFARRDAVERENLIRLDSVRSEPMHFETVYRGSGKYLEAIKKNAPVPEALTLKKGALVMLRTNDPEGRFVNGSLGTVTGMEPDIVQVKLSMTGRTVEVEPVTFDYLDEEGKKVASATNVPLSLAYATTIHKAQGTTLDSILVDLSQLWEPGQAYVALSRARSPQALGVTRWAPRSILADPQVQAFHDALLYED